MGKLHRVGAWVAGLALVVAWIPAGARAQGLPYELFAATRFAAELGVETVRWQEFDDGDQRLLTENGPRLTFGVRADNLDRGTDGFVYTAAIVGFQGDLIYDGQDNNGIFVSSTTGYQGWRIEATAGYRTQTAYPGSALDVFGGLGTENWQRDIHNSTNAVGQAVAGFLEEYTISYARFGLGFRHRHPYGPGYLRMGFKRPFSTDEDVDINGGPVSLTPGKRWSGFVSYDIAFDRPDNRPAHWYARVYYDGYRFSKSGIKAVGLTNVWQPKSNMDQLGVAVGYIY